ncbi:MAG: lysozyme [Methylobacter sp.]
MKALEILLDLIRESEGCKLTAYQDTGGVWTIGWGCTGSGIAKGVTWTQTYANAMLRIRAQKALNDALRVSPVLENESPERQAAIADFIYNIGLGAYKSSTLKKCIDSKYWDAAKVQLKRWVHDAGKVQGGLVTRRQRECDLIDYVKGGAVA